MLLNEQDVKDPLSGHDAEVVVIFMDAFKDVMLQEINTKTIKTNHKY